MVSFISFQIPFANMNTYFPVSFYTIGRLLYILFFALKSTFKAMCVFFARPLPRIHYLAGDEGEVSLGMALTFAHSFPDH